VAKTPLSREDIARRIAQDLADGATVNLGIGIPTLVANYLPAGREIIFHSENGVLGVGPAPEKGREDPNLINASREYITVVPGASFSHQADSFSMTRGGHIDVAVLGALEVSGRGDIANWAVPGKDVLGVGGAMDLVVGARRVIVTMTATSSRGEPKVVSECTYPLTAAGAADVIVTELSVFQLVDGELRLTELLGDATIEDVAAVTRAEFVVALQESRVG
jgi:3-oxoacid CoA-transferase B subunit